MSQETLMSQIRTQNKQISEQNKQIQTLKEEVWGAHLDNDSCYCEYGDTGGPISVKVSECLKCAQEKYEKAEKESEELDALLSDTQAGRVALNARAIYKINLEILEERDILNERLARMGEAFNLIRKNAIDRDQDKDRVDLLLSVFELIEGLSKSGLESYDPKWMSGRLAEAEKKGFESCSCCLDDAQEEEDLCQPN